MQLTVFRGRWYFGIEFGWRWIHFFNYLPPGHRHLGLMRGWYDGPLNSLGFWFFNVAWNF
jgi:hypothetical protein